MSESEPNINETQPLRYRGTNNHYVDIATRNAGEYLGIGVTYAKHPTGVGCFIVRFVAHGVQPSDLKHFAYRQSTNFVTMGPHGKYLKGLRLNKVAIKAFSPAIFPWEIDKYATQFGIWGPLVEWIADQLIAEGFALTTDLTQVIKEMLVPTSKVTAGEVKSALEFPNLDAPEEKASAIKEAAAAKEDADEDEDDEDEDKDDKPWLN